MFNSFTSETEFNKEFFRVMRDFVEVSLSSYPSPLIYILFAKLGIAPNAIGIVLIISDPFCFC